MDTLWPPLFLSLRIATSATILTTLVAVPLAYLLARRRFPGLGLLEALILLPLVLPPTVLGYLILYLFAPHGFLGYYLHRFFNYSIVFRFEGAVLASAIVALPILYMPAKAAFQNVDRELEDISKTLGANRLQVFWHVSLPMARRGLTSGLVLAFARALGEFGATIMVFGWQSNQVPLPIAIFNAYAQDDMHAAWPAVLVLLLTSLSLIVAYNFITTKRTD